jgi:predicted dienelactone hydrolase
MHRTPAPKKKPEKLFLWTNSAKNSLAMSENYLPSNASHTPDPDHEPHKVMLERGMLIDEDRGGREVPIKVYYPVNHKMVNLPVVLWSHGLGGSVDGAAFLSRYLTSHGYVCVHVQHRGTDSTLWEGKKGHPWDIIRKSHIPRSASLNRFHDVPFVLDRLPGWMEAHPDIGLHADLSTLGMSGHSFGAMTTQVMGGMMFPDEQGKLRSFKDTRFKAGILYSPSPIAHLALDDPQDIYGSMHIPLFFMTGTQDESPVEGWDYTKRLVPYEYGGHPEKYLMVLDGGDHMVFTGSRGKLGAHPDRHAHEAAIKTAALTFWNAYLKEDTDAKAALKEFKRQ